MGGDVRQPNRVGANPVGVTFSTAVILSAAKDLSQPERRSFAALRMTDGKWVSLDIKLTPVGVSSARFSVPARLSLFVSITYLSHKVNDLFDLLDKMGSIRYTVNNTEEKYGAIALESTVFF